MSEFAFDKIRNQLLSDHDQEIAAGTEWWNHATEVAKSIVFQMITKLSERAKDTGREHSEVMARMAMIGFMTVWIASETSKEEELL